MSLPRIGAIRPARSTAAACGAVLALALALGLPAAGPAEPLPSSLTDAQIPRIVALGPWPPPAVPDPSNRVAGLPAAVAFGQRLFNEPALSANGRIACASCHQAARGFSDGLARGQGLQRGDRNTPGLLNVGGQRWFGWDGANDSLWAQSLRPLLDAREMGGSLGSVSQAVRATPALRDGYRAAFGEPPGVDDERVAVDAAKALAAYQATLRSGRTPFDQFRDAVARGEPAGSTRAATAASASCSPAATTCSAPSTTTRRARPRRARAMSRSSTATGASSRCRACATWR